LACPAGDHALLVGTIADADHTPKLPPDQADEFVKRRRLLRSTPAEDASWPDHIVDRTNAAESAQGRGRKSTTSPPAVWKALCPSKTEIPYCRALMEGGTASGP
jgi:hypothetical protein